MTAIPNLMLCNPICIYLMNINYFRLPPPYVKISKLCFQFIIADGEVLNFSLLNYDVNTAAGRVIDIIVDITPMSKIVVNITNIPPSSSFLLLQSHSYMYDIILSFNKILTQGSFINGTNIGLVREPTGQTSVTFYLQNGGGATVSVLVAVQAYGADGMYNICLILHISTHL